MADPGGAITAEIKRFLFFSAKLRDLCASAVFFLIPLFLKPARFLVLDFLPCFVVFGFKIRAAIGGVAL